MKCFPGKRHVRDHFGEDFVNAIKKLVTPTRGRKLIVEVLTGALNFKVYLENLDVVVTGLTPNPRAYDFQTSHCWRFVRRMESCLKQVYPLFNLFVSLETCYGIYGCVDLFDSCSFVAIMHYLVLQDLPTFDQDNEVLWSVTEFADKDWGVLN